MKIRFYNIDILRFLFAIGIVLLHVSGMKGIPDVRWFRQCIDNASVIVDCFFMISGFFLHRSLTHNGASFIKFVGDKIARLWPALFASLALLYLAKGLTGSQFIMNAFFLQCIGYTEQFKGITWYVSPLFWGLLFYYGLFASIRSCSRRSFVISFIVYVSYLICMTGGHGGFSRNFAFSLVPMSLCRSLGGLGIGMLIAEYVNCVEGNGERRNVRAWLYTIVEIVATVALFVNLFVLRWAARPLFVIIIFMAVVLIMFVLKRGFFSRVMDRPRLSRLGRYAYSIYIMQPVGMYWLDKLTPSLSANFGGMWIVVMYSSLLVLLGVVTYHLIEIPGSKLVKNLCFGTYDKRGKYE